MHLVVGTKEQHVWEVVGIIDEIRQVDHGFIASIACDCLGRVCRVCDIDVGLPLCVMNRGRIDGDEHLKQAPNRKDARKWKSKECLQICGDR